MAGYIDSFRLALDFFGAGSSQLLHTPRGLTPYSSGYYLLLHRSLARGVSDPLNKLNRDPLNGTQTDRQDSYVAIPTEHIISHLL